MLCRNQACSLEGVDTSGRMPALSAGSNGAIEPTRNMRRKQRSVGRTEPERGRGKMLANEERKRKSVCGLKKRHELRERGWQKRNADIIDQEMVTKQKKTRRERRPKGSDKIKAFIEDIVKPLDNSTRWPRDLTKDEVKELRLMNHGTKPGQAKPRTTKAERFRSPCFFF